MHSGAGRLTEMLYQPARGRGRRARHSHARPARAAHAGREPADVRLDSATSGFTPTTGAAAACRSARSRPTSSTKSREGAADWAIPIVLNRMLMEEPWDLIINVGHVVPHEVLGFANHNKNYFIGLGGKDLICAVAHGGRLAAASRTTSATSSRPCGPASTRPKTNILGQLPDLYVQVVHGPQRRRPAGAHRRATSATIWKPISQPPGNRASRTSPSSTSRCKKIVCVMQGDEFFSTWVANKAVYRTRMALADGGELIDHRPGPEAVRRAARRRRLHPQVRLRAARRA